MFAEFSPLRSHANSIEMLPGRCHAGWRLAKNAVNAFFASSDLTRSANTSISSFTACSNCSRKGRFIRRLEACTAAAGFAARVRAVSVAVARRL